MVLPSGSYSVLRLLTGFEIAAGMGFLTMQII
jgi:hypothetical protein